MKRKNAINKLINKILFNEIGSYLGNQSDESFVDHCEGGNLLLNYLLTEYEDLITEAEASKVVSKIYGVNALVERFKDELNEVLKNIE